MTNVERQSQLTEALVSEFEVGELNRLLNFRLERQQLETTGSTRSMQKAVTGLVQTAESEGWFDQLVAGALAERETSDPLKEFVRTHGPVDVEMVPAGSFIDIFEESGTYLDQSQWLDRLSSTAEASLSNQFKGATARLRIFDWSFYRDHLLSYFAGLYRRQPVKRGIDDRVWLGV